MIFSKDKYMIEEDKFGQTLWFFLALGFSSNKFDYGFVLKVIRIIRIRFRLIDYNFLGM